MHMRWEQTIGGCLIVCLTINALAQAPAARSAARGPVPATRPTTQAAAGRNGMAQTGPAQTRPAAAQAASQPAVKTMAFRFENTPINVIIRELNTRFELNINEPIPSIPGAIS